jgi:uncharacterized protein with FMN-binding domain
VNELYRKIIIVIVSLIFIILFFFGFRYLNQTGKYKKLVSEIIIVDVDLTNIKDGIYKGSFNADMVAADVSITIKENKFTDINIDKHKNERGQKAEIIIDNVISAQSLEVDTISGATNSSKVILKAIENALNQADVK